MYNPLTIKNWLEKPFSTLRSVNDPSQYWKVFFLIFNTIIFLGNFVLLSEIQHTNKSVITTHQSLELLRSDFSQLPQATTDKSLDLPQIEGWNWNKIFGLIAIAGITFVSGYYFIESLSGLITPGSSMAKSQSLIVADVESFLKNYMKTITENENDKYVEIMGQLNTLKSAIFIIADTVGSDLNNINSGILGQTDSRGTALRTPSNVRFGD